MTEFPTLTFFASKADADAYWAWLVSEKKYYDTDPDWRWQGYGRYEKSRRLGWPY
ncbi:MAG: hypothetical protein GXY52_10935 [Chloroflexi bacterium]|nr:hypothetical protein [Chloroflexota bacterium]